MKKPQILFIVFIINIVSLFIRNDAMGQTLDDPAITEEIENKLSKYKKDFEEIEKSIKEISDIDDNLKTNIKKANDKFENYSKIYFSSIENNENLGEIYDQCVDLQIKIDKKIKDLTEGGAREKKKSDFKNKLNDFLSQYKIMKQKGDLFVKNEERDSLKLLKEGEDFIKLNARFEILYTDNEDFIKSEPELLALCDSSNQSKENINKLYLEPKKDIWGIILKIAIVFAIVFFAVMIYNILKSKKLLKAATKKTNDTPEI